MLNPIDNELLTRVDSGTPCGNLLRRYWHPIALKQEFRNSNKKRVRLLGENLILFQKPDGSFGLVIENCLHRSASLYYGFVEDDGIRCAYHGWLFDEDGNCLERPFESKSTKKKLKSYLVEELGGVIFAYLGPKENHPLLPRWDLLSREDGIRTFEIQDDLKCNWLQIQENAADVTHTSYLHSHVFKQMGIKDVSGFDAPLLQYGFQPFKWGILKSWTYDLLGEKDGFGWGNPLIFPNILRIMTEMHWRVPIDNTTTRIFWVSFSPFLSENEREYEEKVICQKKRTTDSGVYLMDTFMSQDAMAVETQGEIANRSSEILGESDLGIIIFRNMLKEQISKVQNGEDPIGTVRNIEENKFIDLRIWMGGYLPMSAPDDPTAKERLPQVQVFDQKHKIVKVPKKIKNRTSS